MSATYLHAVLPALWVLRYLALPLSLGRSAKALRRPEGLALAVVVAVAAVLRLTVAPYGPGDLQNSVPFAYGALLPEFQDFGHYGRAPDVLLRALFHDLGLTPVSDHVFIALNFAASLLSIAAVAGLLWRLGYSSAVGLTGAALVATTSMHLRLSPTYNRYIGALGLCFLGWHALHRFLDERRAADLLLAFAALALAPQFRPEFAWIPFVSAALVFAWWRSSMRALPRAFWAAALLYVAAVGYPIYWTAIHQLATPGIVETNIAPLGPGTLLDPHHSLFLNARYTPTAWTLLALAGAIVGLRDHRWSTAWLLLAGLCATVVIASHGAHDNLCSGRYHLFGLTFGAMVAAVGLGALERWTPKPAVFGALALGVAALGATTWSWVLAPRAVNGEYDFLMEHLGSIPDSCVILEYPEPFDTTLKSYEHLSNTAGRQHRWTSEWPVQGNPACLAYFYSANCSLTHRPEEQAHHHAQFCERIPGQAGEPWATGEAPAWASTGIGLDGDVVPLRLYWLRAPVSHASAGRTGTAPEEAPPPAR